MSPRRSEHAERYLINVNAAGEARAEKKRQLIKLHNLKILKRGLKGNWVLISCHAMATNFLNREDPKEVARTVKSTSGYIQTNRPTVRMYQYTFERKLDFGNFNSLLEMGMDVIHNRS